MHLIAPSPSSPSPWRLTSWTRFVHRWWVAFSRPAGGSPGHVGSRTIDPSTSEDAQADALHDLVVEHGEAVYRMAMSVVRDRALAEDVAQETLMKAWLALPNFRGDSPLRGWILRIARNTAISTLRQRKALPIDPTELPEAPVHSERSVESKVQSGLAMEEFVAALDTLDELSRSVVVLREIEGLTYDEISDVLSVPLPTVKTRLLRARRRLSLALEDWQP